MEAATEAKSLAKWKNIRGRDLQAKTRRSSRINSSKNNVCLYGTLVYLKKKDLSDKSSD